MSSLENRMARQRTSLCIICFFFSSLACNMINLTWVREVLFMLVSSDIDKGQKYANFGEINQGFRWHCLHLLIHACFGRTKMTFNRGLVWGSIADLQMGLYFQVRNANFIVGSPNL